MDINSGLFGPMIITRTGMNKSPSDSHPKDVDQEIVTMFNIIDENASWYLDLNLNLTFGNWTSDIKMNPIFIEGNLKHAVNGYIYANLPIVSLFLNSRVRWHMLALGNERDLHGVHIHGQTFLYDGHRMDVMELIPATMRTVDLAPRSSGFWAIHCHTDHHIMAGMTALFEIKNETLPIEVTADSTTKTKNFLLFCFLFFFSILHRNFL